MEEEPVPSIAESLVGLHLEWPPHANEVFRQLDAALREALEPPAYDIAARLVNEYLERWSASGERWD